MLLISRRRRSRAGEDVQRLAEPASDQAGTTPAPEQAESGSPAPGPSAPESPEGQQPAWRHGGRRAAVLLAVAVTLAAAVTLLLDPGGPAGRAASYGGQLVLAPLGGLLWWRWRRHQDRVLAHLIAWLAATWTVSLLAIVLPGPREPLATLARFASPTSSGLGLLVVGWLCRGRGRRLGLLRVGQGVGLLLLLAACGWVLLLGSGRVITALPPAGRAVALGYLVTYFLSLWLGWYAVFRRRRAGIPGLGMLCLAQALGGGVTALVAVRSLAGQYTFGSPVELGWVAAAALGLTAAASRQVPSRSWERKRQRVALVAVLLIAAGTMTLGVARFVDRSAVELQLQNEQGEGLRAAVEHVYQLTMLDPDIDARTGDPSADALRAYRASVRMHASAARAELRGVALLLERGGASAEARARIDTLGAQLETYVAALTTGDAVEPQNAMTMRLGARLRDGIWAAARDSDRRHNELLVEMRRVSGLLQLAVPLGLLVAGLAFVSSWTTLAKRERLLEDAEARKELTKAVVHAQERERGRIAADLHDGPLQQVAAWRIKVEMVMRKLDRDPAQARELLASLDQEVAYQAVELRRLMHALRPPVLDELGLEAAVGMLARDVACRAGIEVLIEADLDGLRCTPEVETLAYRIVQEGLTNVAKHAAASKAVVGLTATAGRLLVRIADDGRGMRSFEPDRLVREGHFGLAGIDERVEIAGGRLEVTTAGGKGTVLEARLPAVLEETEDPNEEYNEEYHDGEVRADSRPGARFRLPGRSRR